ncbi:MAG: tol-pal system protein YbgF [Candidatus Eisenbacteria bacterium]|nr:tol-pal system protein YbgF [Candidatus Eisenbacteria bacterium]
MNAARHPCKTRTAGALGALAAAALLGGCYSPQLLASRGGLDSLRVQVDTLRVRDSVAYQVLLDTRHEIAAQRDVLLSTRATTGSTTTELFEQMSRLEGKLDEVMGRFSKLEQRSPPQAPPTTAAAPDPAQMYDQAAQDLTQGRYGLALLGFRDFIQRFPGGDLSDNAQYGIGECFFAQARFDSAAIEYAKVAKNHPDGDKVPAALYKLALSQEKLGRAAESKKTLEDLVKRFPLSGEAQLARERLGKGQKR